MQALRSPAIASGDKGPNDATENTTFHTGRHKPVSILHQMYCFLSREKHLKWRLSGYAVYTDNLDHWREGALSNTGGSLRRFG